MTSPSIQICKRKCHLGQSSLVAYYFSFSIPSPPLSTPPTPNPKQQKKEDVFFWAVDVIKLSIFSFPKMSDFNWVEQWHLGNFRFFLQPLYAASNDSIHVFKSRVIKSSKQVTWLISYVLKNTHGWLIEALHSRLKELFFKLVWRKTRSFT